MDFPQLIYALDVGFPEFFLRKKKNPGGVWMHIVLGTLLVLSCVIPPSAQERLLTSLLPKLLGLFPEGL